MQQNSIEQDSNPQIRKITNPDMEIKAMSEFIGRNLIANQVISHVDQQLLIGSGVEESAMPLYDVDTRKPLNIEDVISRRDEMIEQKKIDPMTGAYRREELYTQYPNGFASDKTVIAVDVAGLKLLNDHYGGHKTGDEALKGAVESISQSLPEVKIFRTGGDEFVVVANEVVTAELWDQINKTYKVILQDNTEQTIPEGKTFLRAGVSSLRQDLGKESVRPSTDQVVADADQAEVRIKALLKILGPNQGVPLIASSQDLDAWLEDNNIELVDKGDKIVAYQTWRGGERKILPKFLKKRGSTRVRGRE